MFSPVPRRINGWIRIAFFLLLYSWSPLHTNSAAQSAGKSLPDPCKDISSPTLTDKEATRILARRHKYNCDKIYNNRQRGINAKATLSQNRLVELGVTSKPTALTETQLQ